MNGLLSERAKPLGAPAPSAGAMLQRKCACGAHTPGGGTCESCAGKRRLQRKLTIGSANDPLEHEADRVADQVIAGTATGDAGRTVPRIQRALSSSAGERGDVPESVHRVISSPGRPLDAPLRRDMEQSFGQDFSQVRVHLDGAAAQSARDVQAAAYTAGNQVVFESGQFDPGSRDGRHLLAHELAHVVQQGGRSEVLARAPATRRPAPGAATSANRGRRRQAVPPRNPFVIDYGPPNTGQMLKRDFLGALKRALLEGCDAELRPFGYTARDCPFILRTIGHYARLPASAMIGVVSKFGKVPPGADAATAIAGVVRSSRTVARRLAQKKYPRLQSLARYSNRSASDQNPIAVQRQLGAGSPMRSDVRSRMEHAFGANFGGVRFHDNDDAARLSTDLGARAFTVGQHVAFNHGEYRPGTQGGDWMIAHELAHTMQQDGRHRERGSFDYSALETEADLAANRATRNDQRSGRELHGSELAVQRLPVVVAGAIELGEVALVTAEVTAVSAEVTVTAEAVVIATEIAAPVAVEAATIPVATAVTEGAIVETAAVTTAASTSTTAATTAVAIGAATTLSGDSSTSEKDDRQRNCFANNPFALHCEEQIPLDEVVIDFIMTQGYGFESLGNCTGVSSFGASTIDACAGAPGVSFHCDVSRFYDPIANRQFPGGIVSAFGCTCCDMNGQVGTEWRGLHWSPGSGR